MKEEEEEEDDIDAVDDGVGVDARDDMYIPSISRILFMVMVPSTSRLCLSVGVSCFRLTIQENSPRSSRVTPRTTNSEPPETTC